MFVKSGITVEHCKGASYHVTTGVLGCIK